MPTTPTLITGVDFVAIPARDMETMRDFYENTLGLEPGKLWGRGDGPPKGAEFETGTVTLALVDPTVMAGEFRPNTQPIALQVEDVAAARAELESRGVQFHMETIDSGVCHLTSFSDPDGNLLMLHRRYAPRD